MLFVVPKRKGISTNFKLGSPQPPVKMYTKVEGKWQQVGGDKPARPNPKEKKSNSLLVEEMLRK